MLGVPVTLLLPAANLLPLLVTVPTAPPGTPATAPPPATLRCGVITLLHLLLLCRWLLLWLLLAGARGKAKDGPQARHDAGAALGWGLLRCWLLLLLAVCGPRLALLLLLLWCLVVLLLLLVVLLLPTAT